MRQEILTWKDVDKLVDTLTPQFRGRFDSMVMITRGGIVPGGLLAEALDLRHILTAAVRFTEVNVPGAKLAAWPEFLQFPDEHLLQGRRTLVVDDVWGSGRTITAVKDRVLGAGGHPEMCVFHYNPYRSLFTKAEPSYYAAVTDAFIVYPWEMDRGVDPILAGEPMMG
ncbi:MAG: phosphoribosyltransferase [Chloroflexi bacterium]|nr:phosphoribosyltransferase [Chloroflexota bacterium]